MLMSIKQVKIQKKIQLNQIKSKLKEEHKG